MDLHPDLIELLTEFANSGVEYLVVGGWAVGVHSEPRYTKDLDLLIGPSRENLERVALALERYGVPRALIEEVRTMKAGEFVFFGVPPARIDLLLEIPGVEFARSWTRRKTVTWRGVEVHVLSFEDLVEAKRAAGRPKDHDDVRLLEKFRRKT
jgi:hypothetical protein